MKPLEKRCYEMEKITQKYERFNFEKTEKWRMFNFYTSCLDLVGLRSKSGLVLERDPWPLIILQRTTRWFQQIYY